MTRVRSTARECLDGFPVYADSETAAWVTAPDGFWTGGFWVGLLWLSYLATHHEAARDDALSWIARLAPRADDDTALRGLLFWYGAGIGHQLTHDPAVGQIAVNGARGLANSYRASARLLPVGTAFGDAPNGHTLETNIDGVAGTAALLGWATGFTGDPSLRELGWVHVERHHELCVRQDGSIAQAASVDAATGNVIRSYTQKGLSDHSTWSRGQAWAMLAFAQATRWISPDFTPVATQVADWWIEHLPPEQVAPWDFDDSRHDATRDTSATTIATAALLKLATLVPDRSQAYRHAAESMIEALIDRYVTPLDAADTRPLGMLLAGCYDHRNAWADAHELIWGDYFLYEALLALTGTIDPNEI